MLNIELIFFFMVVLVEMLSERALGQLKKILLFCPVEGMK